MAEEDGLQEKGGSGPGPGGEKQQGDSGEDEREGQSGAAAEKRIGALEAAAEKKPGESGQDRPMPEPKEIVAPEALPAVERAAGPSPIESRKQPVMPEEGGVPLVTEPLSIQWAEEAIAEEAKEKGAGKDAGKEAPAAEKAPVPAEGKLEGPAPPSRPLWPYYEPLPAQFRGTLADIRRFIGAGELFLLAGGAGFFLLALARFGAAVADSRHPWSAPVAASDVLWGLLALVLSTGSLICLLLSRRKLRGPYARNDFRMLHRRLVPACAAGLVLGLLFGGVFYFLAYVKVDELPVAYRV